jgi:hypothetical protein
MNSLVSQTNEAFFCEGFAVWIFGNSVGSGISHKNPKERNPNRREEENHRSLKNFLQKGENQKSLFDGSVLWPLSLAVVVNLIFRIVFLK